MPRPMPEINEKFYQAGRKIPTLHALHQQIGSIPEPQDFPESEAHEAKVMSLMFGFADALIARLTR
jgi:hypothetical protein